MTPTERRRVALALRRIARRHRQTAEDLMAIAGSLSRDDPEAFRSAREELGFTQDDAASRIGVSVRTVRSWEQGIVNTPPDAVRRLQEATP
jgi:DNA-binding transcriptional regulator YiaG